MPAGKGKKADAAGAPAPAAVPDPVDDAASLKDEAEALEASIAAGQARLAEIRAKRDFKEFPKFVKGQIFASREEQDAAGPDYADEV